MRVIGLSGKIGSGKTTAALYLNKTYGFENLSTRKLLADILQANGLEVDRRHLQVLGSKLTDIIGGAGFVALMLVYLPDKNYVIDSIRFPDAVDYLRRRLGNRYFHIHLMVSDEIRFDRLRKKDDFYGRTNLAEVESAETERWSEKLRELADYSLLNDADKTALLSHIDEILRRVDVDH